jgi:hypothetical protein
MFLTVQTPSKVSYVSVNNLPQNIQSFGGELKYVISDRLPPVKTKHMRRLPPPFHSYNYRSKNRYLFQ